MLWCSSSLCVVGFAAMQYKAMIHGTTGILVLTSAWWMRFSEQSTVGTAPELEAKPKGKQESIEEPNKSDKTCNFGLGIPEDSVGPRNYRKGLRQPCPSFGWFRWRVGLLFCCLMLAPASAVAHPMLDETQMLNDSCCLDALTVAQRAPPALTRALPPWLQLTLLCLRVASVVSLAW